MCEGGRAMSLQGLPCAMDSEMLRTGSSSVYVSDSSSYSLIVAGDHSPLVRCTCTFSPIL